MNAASTNRRDATACSGKVYLIHEDEGLRDALSLLFRSRGVRINAFASGAEFFDAFDSDAIGCLILDIRMGGAAGARIFDHLRERACRLPVILLTEYGDTSKTESALKNAVVEFVEMPFDANELVDRVLQRMEQDGRGCSTGTEIFSSAAV